MKRTLLLLVLFASFSFVAFSQTLSLYDASGLLAPDAPVVISGQHTDPDITCLLFVKNNSSSTQQVLMKKVIIDTASGSINSFCWGANCFPPFVYQSPDAVDITAGDIDSTFSAHYEPYGVAATSIIRYVFFLRDNNQDSVSMRAYFQAFPVGVDSKNTGAVLSGIYPNPAIGHFNVKYNVPSGSEATLIVRDVLGAVKYQENIAGTGSMNISTSALTSGMYFCTIQVDGKNSVTKKVLVR